MKIQQTKTFIDIIVVNWNRSRMVMKVQKFSIKYGCLPKKKLILEVLCRDVSVYSLLRILDINSFGLFQNLCPHHPCSLPTNVEWNTIKQFVMVFFMVFITLALY